MSQLDRANALARARDDGEREGTIAAMAECIGAARYLARESVGTLDEYACAAINGLGDALLRELERRYGASDPRVLHHLRLRGLR